MRFLSLFSGIGAFDYGLERADMTCVGQVEIDPFCNLVLAKHWPGVHRWNDVRIVTGDAIQECSGPIDVIAGGFPCQPHSLAGKRKGTADDRHLWPEFARLIGELRPAWVIAENVPGLRTTAADEVLGDLESQDYAATAIVVGANDVGAPHRRQRVWIVANSRGTEQHWIPSFKRETVSTFRNTGERELAHAARDGERRTQRTNGERIGAPSDGVGNPNAVCPGLAFGQEQPTRKERATTKRVCDTTGSMADAADYGCAIRPWLRADWERTLPSKQTPGIGEVSRGGESVRCGGTFWPARPGQPQHEWEYPRLANPESRASECGFTRIGANGSEKSGQPECPMGTATDGASRRLVRLARRLNRESLKAAGNAVVWVIPYLIGCWIMKQENA